MSRIGRKPIVIPAGVEVKLDGNNVTVKGPKGTLNSNIHPMMQVKMENGEVVVTRPNDDKTARSLHGLSRTIINNMVEGVQFTADDKQGMIRITLKYNDAGQSVITGLRRVSKPGLRIYTNCEDMPKVMRGLGIAIISTSKGVMTDKAARANKVGGEVLAFVW